MKFYKAPSDEGAVSEADWGRETVASLPSSALRAATSLIRGRLFCF